MRAKQEKILKIVITAIMVILGLICIYPLHLHAVLVV